jgi:hypothetical protein
MSARRRRRRGRDSESCLVISHIYKDAWSLAQAKGLPSLIYHEPVLEVRFVRGAAGTMRILTIRHFHKTYFLSIPPRARLTLSSCTVCRRCSGKNGRRRKSNLVIPLPPAAKPRHLRLAVHVHTNASLPPQHVRCRTTFCKWGSAPLPDNHTAHRWATRPDTGAFRCFRAWCPVPSLAAGRLMRGRHNLCASSHLDE